MKLAKLSGLLIVVGLAAVLNAQESAPMTLQHRAPAPSQYVLGPGDQINLHVTDMDEISDKPIKIGPNGNVDIPLAGEVHAGGLTIDQFRTALAAKLSKYINSPEISVNLTQGGSAPVSVVGEVNNPGVHQLEGSKRLLEVISLSGGLKEDAGPKVIVTREPRWGGIEGTNAKIDPVSGYTTATFSVDELMSGKVPQDNIVVEPNDVISIPRADLVYVVGDVKKAGGFALTTHPTVTLLQALALAEGLGPDEKASHSKILRAVPGGDGTPREIPVDLKKILEGKAPDMPLYANDILFIPSSAAKSASRRAIEAAIGVGTGVAIYR
jgi:polysaccharide export outer membrane protein